MVRPVKWSVKRSVKEGRGMRECLEETGLEVRVTALLDVIARQEHPRGAHILIVYRAEILAGELKAGDDAEHG